MMIGHLILSFHFCLVYSIKQWKWNLLGPSLTANSYEYLRFINKQQSFQSSCLSIEVHNNCSGMLSYMDSYEPVCQPAEGLDFSARCGRLFDAAVTFCTVIFFNLCTSTQFTEEPALSSPVPSYSSTSCYSSNLHVNILCSWNGTSACRTHPVQVLNVSTIQYWIPIFCHSIRDTDIIVIFWLSWHYPTVCWSLTPYCTPSFQLLNINLIQL